MGDNSESNGREKLLKSISKMHLIRLRRIVSLPKMLIRQNLWWTALLHLFRHSPLGKGQRRIGSRLVELLNLHRNRCEIPLISGALERDLGF
jgi:hypothetical protein